MGIEQRLRASAKDSPRRRISNDGPSANGPAVRSDKTAFSEDGPLVRIFHLFKFGLISIVTLFLVWTVLSLIFPTDVRIGRTINVAASRQRVAAAVSDFHTWGEWNDFLQAPQTNIKYSPSRGTGAWLRSDQLTITMESADSNGVMLDWNLAGRKRLKGGMQFMYLNSDSLTIQWWFDVHFHWYPWERMGSFIYDRRLGPFMEQSLKGLKQFVEKPL